MEKKVTRRIIGILVVVALVIILLPLMNMNDNDSQGNLQTTEVKAPPFPDPQNEGSPAANAETAANTTPQTATPAPATVAANNPMSLHSILNNIIYPKKSTPETQPPAPVAAANAPTPATTQAAPQTVATNNSNPVPPPTAQVVPPSDTNTFPQEETLASNSATDPEEEIEQADNTFVPTPTKQATVVADNTPSKIESAMAPVRSDASTALNAPAPQTVAAKAPATPAAAHTKTVATTETKALTQSEPAPQPTVISNVEPSVEPTPAAQQPVMEVTRTAKKAPLLKVQTTKVAVVKTKTITESDDEEDDIAAAKQSAWVVQMGSFKSKVNAERLTNTLRAKGYKAFTYETKSNGQTRVYVGPQYKQVAAASIANKIESDLNMHGIVVSFKPMEL